MSKCEFCGKGELIDQLETESFNYRGHSKMLVIEYSTCSHCGIEITNYDQVKRNQQTTMKFYDEVDYLIDNVKYP